MQVTGLATIRNGIEVGYPFIESFLSIYPVVDEYLINDGGSDDGTLKYLERMERTFRKVVLYNIEDFPGTKWDCVDNSLNIMMKDSEGDWLFESQADELYHERDLPPLMNELKRVSNEGYNSIRQRRMDVSNLRYDPNSYDYRVVRLVRNLPNLVSYWGGDDFQLGKEVHYREGTTSHYVPPEWGSNIIFYHITGGIFTEDHYSRAKRHAEYLARGHAPRVKALDHATDRLPYYKGRVPSPTPSLEIPILIQTLTRFDRYVPRDELFDIEWLNRTTGLDYG